MFMCIFLGSGRPVSATSSELAFEDDAEFDLAKTYIENPAKYYAQQQQRQQQQQPQHLRQHDSHRREDQSSGYEVMPVDDPNYNRRRPGQGQGQELKDRVQAQVHAQNPKKPYRYENGRPLSSSRSGSESDQSFDVSQNSVSMAAAGAPLAGSGAAVIPEAIKDKAKLIYNPKDGQWYYYYKGKPISKYDPTKVVKNPSGKPEYKYINGRPVLLPVPTKPLNPPM